jgi:hypothetical protein
MNIVNVSKLQTALIKAGVESIPFHNGGVDYPLAVKDMPDATLVAILNYGKRMFNDYVNSAKHAGGEAEEAAEGWIVKAKAGALGGRSGGARLSPLLKAQRGIVVCWLREAGWDAKEAVKAAKNPQQGFKAMLALQIARGKGIAVSAVEPELVEAAFEKNWHKVEAKAQVLLETTTGMIEIDL